jgi:adenosylhomocysteine nucleosidase
MYAGPHRNQQKNGRIWHKIAEIGRIPVIRIASGYALTGVFSIDCNRQETEMQKPLIVMALESEGQGLLESLGFDVLYCGVGKINAAYQLTRRLLADRNREHAFSYVLNMGSAGSHTFSTGMLVAADRFIQHDMNAASLGFAHGETPYDPTPPMITFPRRFDDLPHGVCGSGDCFVQGGLSHRCDIVDMEAYAFAKICLLESLPFACVKYITDEADSNASRDWETNLKRAAEKFAALLKD